MNITNKIKKLNRGKLFQVIISLLIIVAALIVVLLNITGLYKITDNQLLNIIIILLCSVAIIYVIEEIDVFEEIKMQVTGLPNKIDDIENIISKNQEKNLESIQHEIKDVENELIEVHKLVKDTHTTKGVVVNRKELERNRSLDEVWNNADEIYLLAIANTSFLRGNGIYKIQEAVGKGVKFKLVTLNPAYDAIKEYIESRIISPTSLPLSDNINAYIKVCKGNSNGRNVKKRTNNFSTMVDFRLTTYLLPYSMMIVKRNGKTSTIKVDLYGVDIDYTDRRSFYIPAEDEENIQFYEEQWNMVWENSEKTIPVDMEKIY